MLHGNFCHVIVIFVVRYCDTSLMNELRQSIAVGNVPETSQNDGCNQNRKAWEVLFPLYRLRIPGTVQQVRFVNAVCVVLIFNVCYRLL
jgi:hypothetical protein